MARLASLAARGVHPIKQQAFKLGVKGPRPHHSLVCYLTDEQVAEVVRLHDVEGRGFKRIGERYGVAETTASNAYYKAMCRVRGFRPAERDDNGHLLPAEIERLRAFLRKGTKPRDIQLYMGISAGAICNERRQYAAELKARGKRPLPPPGNGERYSGAKIPAPVSKEVERLYLAGHATIKVSELTGVSHTHALRMRTRLIRRLRRKSECLPGCDLNGKRLTYPDTILRVPEAQKQQLRALLMEQVPVKQAAELTGIGGSMAYRERDLLKAELESRGQALPSPKRGGSRSTGARWLPVGRRWIILYRQLGAVHGDDEAKRIIVDGIAAFGELPRAIYRAWVETRRSRPATFEEQLARVAAGAGLSATFRPTRLAPSFTLGGVATAQL